MKNTISTIVAGMICLMSISVGMAEENDGLIGPYPLEYFAQHEAINKVLVSPDGARVAMLRFESRDSNPVLEIYDTADLAAEPYQYKSGLLKITDYYWSNDTQILFSGIKTRRSAARSAGQSVSDSWLARLHVTTKRLETFDLLNGSIESLGPASANKVILSYDFHGGSGSNIREEYRPRAYYELDLKTSYKTLLIRGKTAIAQVQFDRSGSPFAARGFNAATSERVFYYRAPGSSEWDEIHRLDDSSFEDFGIVGLDDEKPGNLLVTAQNGHDKIGLWSFNTLSKEFEELIYRRSDVDVAGIRYHSNPWEHPDRVVAVGYFKDKSRYEYFDELEGATYRQLEDLIPFAHDLRITSRSRDGQSLTVYNEGPRDPGSYYLLSAGTFVLVGRKQPLLESQRLADVEFTAFKSRDGLTVPAFITVPHGEPPFPAVVMPHDGPFTRETVGFDPWGQLLANNGYLVLQPQFRGSKGLGIDFYTRAFRDGGQGGYRMQDDLDDSVLHLVKKGLVDPARVAIFGWSYGGYASLTAASRKPQHFRCAIAAAGVTDARQQVDFFRNQLRSADRQAQVALWSGSISPVKEADKISIPVLMIHGDADQRNPPVQIRQYLNELDRNDVDYRMVWLKGADHSASALNLENQVALYENLVVYLGNECGSDGLKAD